MKDILIAAKNLLSKPKMKFNGGLIVLVVFILLIDRFGAETVATAISIFEQSNASDLF